MRNIFLLSLLSLGAFGACVAADNYRRGYSNSYSYPSHSYSSYSYPSYSSYSPGYYGSGYYYTPSYSYYTYPSTAYYSVPTYQQTTTNYVAPKVEAKSSWREELLKLATNRDKQILDIRKGALEQQWFSEAVKELGLTGNFNVPGYGLPLPPTGVYSAYPYAAPAALGTQGTTVYGYTAQSVLSAYGDTNIPQLYQQAARLADGAQKLGAQATTDFSALVQQEGINRTKVLEILARAEAAQKVLSSLEMPSSKVESSATILKAVPGGQAETAPVLPPVALGLASNSRASFLKNRQVRCASCHSGGKSEGGFRLEDYDTMPFEAKGRVIGRLVRPATDPKHMPKDGPMLSQAEIREWIEN